uniref:hypothetical protein n=1 Tax=Neokomagataea thailandica TaxID=661190 RepID=UPI003570BA61
INSQNIRRSSVQANMPEIRWLEDAVLVRKKEAYTIGRIKRTGEIRLGLRDIMPNKRDILIGILHKW